MFHKCSFSFSSCVLVHLCFLSHIGYNWKYLVNNFSYILQLYPPLSLRHFSFDCLLSIKDILFNVWHIFGIWSDCFWLTWVVQLLPCMHVEFPHFFCVGRMLFKSNHQIIQSVGRYTFLSFFYHCHDYLMLNTCLVCECHNWCRSSLGSGFKVNVIVLLWWCR